MTYLPAFEAGIAASCSPAFGWRCHPGVSIGPRSFVSSAAALIPSACALAPVLPARVLCWAVSSPVPLLQASSSQEVLRCRKIKPTGNLSTLHSPGLHWAQYRRSIGKFTVVRLDKALFSRAFLCLQRRLWRKFVQQCRPICSLTTSVRTPWRRPLHPHGWRAVHTQKAVCI